MNYIVINVGNFADWEFDPVMIADFSESAAHHLNEVLLLLFEIRLIAVSLDWSFCDKSFNQATDMNIQPNDSLSAEFPVQHPL